MFYKVAPSDFVSQMDVIICYCIYDDKMLFLKRKSGKNQEQTWTAPGGKKEKEETSKEGVCREVYEETGLVINEEGLEDSGLFYVRLLDFNYTIQIFKYYLSALPEEIKLSEDEHDEYMWVTKEQALNLPLIAEGDKCLLATFPTLLKV